MKKIIASRNTGKTSMLVHLSATTGNTLVCGGYNEIHLIKKLAEEAEIQIPMPITYRQFIDKDYHVKSIKGFLIDNAEHLLQQMSAVNICAITMSIDDAGN